MSTYYITKYALNGGIKAIEAEATYPEYAPKGWVFVPTYHTHFYIGRDAFDNLPDAIADAEQRRTKKIASLKKQIAKLEKLEFGS